MTENTTPTPDPNLIEVPPVVGGIPSNKKLLQLRMVSGDRERISINLSATHQQKGHSPRTFETRVSADLEYGEEADSRNYTLKADSEWLSIQDKQDRVEHPGTLIIINKTGTTLQVQPTPEELAELMKAVVLIKVGDSKADPPFQVSPFGRPFFAELRPGIEIKIKCEHGVAAVTAAIIPR